MTVVSDHKRHNCAKCRNGNIVTEFVIYGSKYNRKLSKTCTISIDYRRKEDEMKHAIET